MTIPFSPPDITELEREEVLEALSSGWITTGPRTKKLESLIAEACLTKRAVCLSSATAALELTLRMLGIGPGDEVIVPAYTYTASASPIAHVGAKIVFVDANISNFELNIVAVENAISSRTKAIIGVDIAGKMCDYETIRQIASSKCWCFEPNSELQEALGRIAIIADGAHSFGATRNNIPSGAAADFTTFSFHAVKNLTTGEGGAVTWLSIPGVDDNWLYEQYMLMSLHGQSKDALAKSRLGNWEYDIVTTGYKYNMTDVCAAIGLGQMSRYKTMLERRTEIIRFYDEAFYRYGVTAIKHSGNGFRSSGHLYLCRIPGMEYVERNLFIENMAGGGVSCNVHYKPLTMMTAYRKMGYAVKDTPHAYHLYENEVTLPLHTMLSDSDIEKVAFEMTDKLKGWKRLSRISKQS